MNCRSQLLLLLCLSVSIMARGQAQNPGTTPNNGMGVDSRPIAKLPKEVILVKGAWSSASDSVAPVPEAGTVAQDVFSNPYFGITYPLPQNWVQEFDGPPPSDTARYVIAQLGPPAQEAGPDSASMLVTAQDLFFTPPPAANALQFAEYVKNHLQSDYELEAPLKTVVVAGRSFSFFAYRSPIAGLHWYVLTIEIRCHAVQFVLTSRDPKLLDRLMLGLNKMKLPADVSATAGAGGALVPVCIKDYARGDNVLARVDPVFTEHQFNPIPVRIIIDKEGRVRHVHLINAFPDQAKAITEALQQWKFRIYLIDGQPAEVETGILFGRAAHTLPASLLDPPK